MSDAVIGVIVGGIIGSIMPLATLYVTEKRARQERIVAHLKEKRVELIKEYSQIKELLSDGMSKNSYPIDMISKLKVLLPKNVFDAFEKMMTDKDEEDGGTRKKFHYLDILNEMHKSIAEIDERIEKEIGE